MMPASELPPTFHLPADHDFPCVVQQRRSGVLGGTTTASGAVLSCGVRERSSPVRQLLILSSVPGGVKVRAYPFDTTKWSPAKHGVVDLFAHERVLVKGWSPRSSG